VGAVLEVQEAVKVLGSLGASRLDLADEVNCRLVVLRQNGGTVSASPSTRSATS
jgi:hypothetical protein